MLLVYFSAQTTWALVLLGLVVLLAAIVAIQAHRHRASGGNEELPGMVGEVTEPSDARGRAWAMVRGEAWQVHCGQPLSTGQSVRVQAVHGLLLEVVPVRPDGAISEAGPDHRGDAAPRTGAFQAADASPKAAALPVSEAPPGDFS